MDMPRTTGSFNPNMKTESFVFCFAVQDALLWSSQEMCIFSFLFYLTSLLKALDDEILVHQLSFIGVRKMIKC